MGRSMRRLVSSSLAILAVALLVTMGVVAQMDPRNTSDEYFDAVNNALCYEHHFEDGFSPFGFRFNEAYSQLPIGEVVDINVVLFENTQYQTHETYDISVVIDTSEARNVRVMTVDLPEDILESFGGTQTLADGDSMGNQVYIGPGASSGVLRATVEDVTASGIPLGGLDPGELIVNAGGVRMSSNDGEIEMALDSDFFQERGHGNYTFETTWRSPYPDGISAQAQVSMELEVFFEQEGSRFMFTTDTRMRVGTERAVVTVPVQIMSEEPAHLDFEIHATVYWPHKVGDGAPLDEGEFTRFLTMDVQGGEELIVASQLEAPTPVGPVVNVYNLLTRLLGFIGLFLVTAAMFTGGVFGKKSRRFMNKFTGGAKKRVLWHSSMGFLILVVASIHFSFALLETRNDISRGLFWGGMAWVLLISLGLTGYYQVRMIKKWNYKLWRHVHLWSAVAVLTFVLIHAVLEGADFSAIRGLLPDWLVERLIWPRAP